MSHILDHSESIQQEQCQKQREPSHSEPSNHKINAEAEKNKRWNQVQHIHYLIFLQKNREKIKSKLIRRSNSFFREMSFFIISKSPIQCRSYHQKYEGKHKYPHRIIRQQKVKINVTLYEHLLRDIQEKIQKDLIPFMKKDQAQKTQTTIQKKETRTIEIQTDIQGIDTIIIPQNHVSQNYNSGIFSPQIYQNYYSNFVWMNCRQHAYPFWN